MSLLICYSERALKMYIKYTIFIFLVSLLSLIAMGLILTNLIQKRKDQVCFQDYCFDVELAVSSEERKKGLMFREQIDSDKGMLFIFEKPGKHIFWMKNVSIPLDIIWINENNEIVFISENTQPCKYLDCPKIEPNQSAKYVLEIRAGMSKEIGLTKASKLDIKID